MPTTPVHHRLPRAGVDPIGDAITAFLIVSAAIHRPLRHETIVVLLDHERRGIGIVVVSGTESDDAVVEVVEFIAGSAAHDGQVGAIIVASIRPVGDGDTDDGCTHAASAVGDVDRWLEMSDLADQAGVEVVEWFVVDRAVRCPRDDLGEPPRW